MIGRQVTKLILLAAFIAIEAGWSTWNWTYCNSREHTPGFCVEWTIMGMIFPLVGVVLIVFMIALFVRNKPVRRSP